MYDAYTQLALQDQLVKQAVYNRLAQEALIKYAGLPGWFKRLFGYKEPPPKGFFEKVLDKGKGAGEWLLGKSKYLAELAKAHPWRTAGIGAGALLGLGGAGYGLSHLMGSSPEVPLPEPSVFDTLSGLAPGAGIGALAGAGLGGLGTLAVGGREARKEAIRNALIGALLGAAGGAGASYAGLI